MTGRELLDFLLKQNNESLSLDISVLNNENGEFFHIDRVYIHDENNEKNGDVLDNESIVLEFN